MRTTVYPYFAVVGSYICGMHGWFPEKYWSIMKKNPQPCWSWSFPCSSCYILTEIFSGNRPFACMGKVNVTIHAYVYICMVIWNAIIVVYNSAGVHSKSSSKSFTRWSIKCRNLTKQCCHLVTKVVTLKWLHVLGQVFYPTYQSCYF